MELEKLKNIIIFLTILIFDGEYLNGEKNGQGKEYSSYNDGIIFDGEKYVIDTEKNKLIFEGAYLNGKRNGKEKNMIIMVY